MRTLNLKKDSQIVNQELSEWIINKGITRVIITGNFDNSIDNLPDCIKSISIKYGSFNQPINKWPLNLSSLEIIAIKFQQVIKNLPNIEELRIDSYKKDFVTIPYSVKILIIKILHSDHDLDKLINLHTLRIKNTNNKISKFPPNLKKFSANEYKFELDNLPNSLNYLSTEILFENTVLPKNIAFIDCFVHCSNPFAILPKKLTHFHICWYDEECEKILPGLPDTLVELYLSCINNLDKNLKLPSGLKKLIIENSDINLTNLPNQLTELTIMHISDYKLTSKKEIILPPKLKTLMIQSKSEFISILNESLPETLRNIDIEKSSYLKNLMLPSKLKSLSIPDFDLFINQSKNIKSISSLQIYCKENIFSDSVIYNKNILELLPDNIKELDIHHHDIFDYTKLFNSITKLKININNDTNIGMIPQNITDLEICKNKDDDNHVKLKISDLSLTNITDLKIIADFINDEVLDNLPKSLEKLDLDLRKTNTKLEHLPETLKHLFVFIDDYEVRTEHLPENLLSLVIRLPHYNFEKRKNYHLDNLPKSLRYIDIY